MKPPHVNIRCVAQHYASPGELIVEFCDPETGAGGLISFSVKDGRLVIQPYQMTGPVVVHGRNSR